MKTLVVDASAAASWLLASQATRPALELLDQLDAWRLVAPYVFDWEVGNLLVRQARREAAFDLTEAFAQLAAFEIDTAPAPDRDEINRLASIAAAKRLSLFDASYLYLTLGLDGALASRDGSLLAVALAAGVDVFDLRG
ncbi:MAG: type II toxin-antitoxin system VapC family toxin [Brevundimonas sp.]|uniref:type II toxin-antitoxin system VapC family toxin n=1 Tax=Brevundimonas sp. TaxID=1871086 RepID=UPI0039190565